MTLPAVVSSFGHLERWRLRRTGHSRKAGKANGVRCAIFILTLSKSFKG